MSLVSEIVRIIFLSPAVLIVLLILAGIFSQKMRGLFITSAIFLYILSSAYAPKLLLLPLEKEYILTKPNFQGINSVVVLGGGLVESSTDSKLSQTAFKRFVQGLGLARSLNVSVIYSGGGLERGGQSITEADAALQTATTLCKEFGFIMPILTKPTGAFGFLAEKRSETTSENAFFTANIFHDAGILKPKIALVTSASHMKRAKMHFERHGFTVVPVAVDFSFDMNRSMSPSLNTLAPNFDNLKNSLTALYEYLGLAKYYIWGK